MQRQQREAAFVDLDMEHVERAVARQDACDEVAVAVDQALDGQPDLFLRQPAHFEQTGLELFELRLKVPDALLRRSHYPNLPVM